MLNKRGRPSYELSGPTIAGGAPTGVEQQATGDANITLRASDSPFILGSGAPATRTEWLTHQRVKFDCTQYQEARGVACVVESGAGVLGMDFGTNDSSFSAMSYDGDVQLSLGTVGTIAGTWMTLKDVCIGDCYFRWWTDHGSGTHESKVGNVYLQFRGSGNTRRQGVAPCMSLSNDQSFGDDFSTYGSLGSPMNWQGAWSSATAYSTDDGVSFGGDTYICIADNTNAEPDTHSADWTLVPADALFAASVYNPAAPDFFGALISDPITLETTSPALFTRVGPHAQYISASPGPEMDVATPPYTIQWARLRIRITTTFPAGTSLDLFTTLPYNSDTWLTDVGLTLVVTGFPIDVPSGLYAAQSDLFPDSGGAVKIGELSDFPTGVWNDVVIYAATASTSTLRWAAWMGATCGSMTKWRDVTFTPHVVQDGDGHDIPPTGSPMVAGISVGGYDAVPGDYTYNVGAWEIVDGTVHSDPYGLASTLSP